MAQSESYQLRQFTSASLAATRTMWQQQLKTHQKELLESEWERVLDHAGKHINYAVGDQFCYGVFKEGGHAAVAIVVLVYRKEACKWLKLLELNLCPAVDLSLTSHAVDFNKLSSIFAAAVFGTIQLTGTAHPTNVTKLYGRSGTLLAYLEGIQEYIQQSNTVPGLTVSIEGRWLVFEYEAQSDDSTGACHAL